MVGTQGLAQSRSRGQKRARMDSQSGRQTMVGREAQSREGGRLVQQPRLREATFSRTSGRAQQLRSLGKSRRPECECRLCLGDTRLHPPSQAVVGGTPHGAACGALTPGTRGPTAQASSSPSGGSAGRAPGAWAPRTLSDFAPVPRLSVPAALEHQGRAHQLCEPRLATCPLPAPTWHRPSPPGRTRTHCGSWSGSR